MSLIGRKQSHVSRTNLFDWPAFPLCPTETEKALTLDYSPWFRVEE